jgi:hypothetical protein
MTVIWPTVILSNSPFAESHFSNIHLADTVIWLRVILSNSPFADMHLADSHWPTVIWYRHLPDVTLKLADKMFARHNVSST